LVVGTSTIRPIPSGDSSSFIIHDNSSQIAKFIPEKYVEPLVIVARILGFDGIDEYIIHLIKDELEMFADTRNDLDDSFQKYMHDMIIGKDVPNMWKRAPHQSTTTKTGGEEVVETDYKNKENRDEDDVK
jgi:hypothetical protein